MGSGKNNFTTLSGVQYVLDKYLSDADRRHLRFLNNGLRQDQFKDELITRVHSGAGGEFIPENYEDEFTSNGSALIGSMTTIERLKTKEKSVTVYETQSGKKVYEDSKGRLREFRTGRYISRKILEE